MKQEEKIIIHFKNSPFVLPDFFNQESFLLKDTRIFLFCFYKVKLVMLFLFILTTIFLNAQSRPIQKLAPGVFYYFGDELQKKSANCLWVVFKDYVLAVDANYPWGAEEIIREIRKTSDKPVRFVFNTHYHHDHTWGNSVFVDSGAVVVASQATTMEMQTLGQFEWDRRSSYSGGDMNPYRREFPTLTFDQRMIFDDGTHRVELIRMGPAHTAGDAVAWLPKEKILATGDLCVNGNPWGNNVADKNADYDRWLTDFHSQFTVSNFSKKLNFCEHRFLSLFAVSKKFKSSSVASLPFGLPPVGIQITHLLRERYIYS